MRNAIEGLPTKDCVVFNGDVLHDFDLPAILRDHEESDAAATLTLYTVQRPHPYGVVPTDERRRVQAFLEPTQEQKKAADRGEKQEGTDNINAGLYVFRGEVAESIPLRRCNIEREFSPSLIASGALVLGHITDGYWTDVGRPAQLLAATRAILSGTITVAMPPAGEKREGVYAGEGAQWTGASVAAGCAIGRSCSVAEGATVDDYSALGEGCRVESGARVSASILLPGVTVGEGAVIEGCLIDRDCKIGEAAHLRNVVLGAGSIASATLIPRRSRRQRRLNQSRPPERREQTEGCGQRHHDDVHSFMTRLCIRGTSASGMGAPHSSISSDPPSVVTRIRHQ